MEASSFVNTVGEVKGVTPKRTSGLDGTSPQLLGARNRKSVTSYIKFV